MPDKVVPDNRIDPNVSVPAAVKASAAAAQAAFDAAYKSNEAADGDKTGENNTNPGTNGHNNGVNGANGANGTPNTADAGGTDPGNPPPVTKELQSEPSTTVSRAKTHSNDPQSGDSASADEGRTVDPSSPSGTGGVDPEEERRYKAMKGRHDRLANENRALASRLASMEQTLASLKPKEGVTPQSNGATPPDGLAEELTPEERTDYGDDFLGIVAKQAKITVAPLIKQLQTENEQLKVQLGKVGSHLDSGAKIQMEAFLNNNLPEWHEINQNEEFLNWLAQADSYSGHVRLNLLRQAYERNDAPRVLAFFKGFQADEAAVAPANPNATNGAGTPAQGNPPSKVPLDRFAAPGRARSTASTTPVEKPTISPSQIANFYSHVAAGKYVGNETEKNRLEAMIFEAQREGRIR